MTPKSRIFERKRGTDRKSLIAQAVIAILGTQGARGLTHRAVDAFLNLPIGSTAYYFRNKSDLLLSGFNELIQPQRFQGDEFAEFLASEEFGRDPIRALAEKEHQLWERATSEENRPNILARFEFFLMSCRDPEMRARQEAVMRQVFLGDVVAFAKAGAKNPCRAAAELGDLRRGHIMTFCLVPAARWGRDFDVDYLHRKIVGIIQETDAFESDLDSPGTPAPDRFEGTPP